MEKIEFQQGGLFHDMVTAYISALSGLLLFRKEFKFDLSVKVGLASTVRTLEFPVQETKDRFNSGTFPLGMVSDQLTLMLINAAGERAKAKYGDAGWSVLRHKYSEVDFLSHARNAASHGGAWHFTGDEPKARSGRQPKWRGHIVTASLHDTPLLGADLKPADLLWLLSDIEKLLIP